MGYYKKRKKTCYVKDSLKTVTTFNVVVAMITKYYILGDLRVQISILVLIF